MSAEDLRFTDTELARAECLVGPQSAPANTGSQACWPLVILDVPTFAWARSLAPVRRLMIADILARDTYGRNKYKVPLTYDNNRDHLQDAYQEALDMVAYLKAESMAGDDTGVAALLYRKAILFALELRTAIAQRDGECQ